MTTEDAGLWQIANPNDLLEESRRMLANATELRDKRRGKVRATQFGDGRTGRFADAKFGFQEEVTFKGVVTGICELDGRFLYRVRVRKSDGTQGDSIIITDEGDITNDAIYRTSFPERGKNGEKQTNGSPGEV